VLHAPATQSIIIYHNSIQDPEMQTYPLTGSLRPRELCCDRQSLIACYERYHSELYRFAYRLLGDAETAEDCVSETFCRLLKAVQEGRGPQENARAYLYRVARNWITDFYRSRPYSSTSLDSELDGDPDANPSRLVAERLEHERVRAAVLCLPPDQQQVIILRFVEDWSHEEVAAALGRSIEATRTLQHRALAALRQLLSLEEAGFISSPRGMQRSRPVAVP
jgi:RNA polymerase sigma-70 factor (ECF subfamily)